MSPGAISVSRRPAAALCAVVLALALAACGSSASSTTNAANASGSTAGSQTARVNLAKCLRAQGINVPDSGTTAGAGGAGGGGGGGIFQAFRNYPRAKVTAATKACSQYLKTAFPGAALSPAQQAQRRAQLVKFAECMRSHGVNIPDPTTGGTGPGGGFAFRQSFQAAASSPAFKSANTACSSLRPRFGRGGGPAGGGAPGATAGA